MRTSSYVVVTVQLRCRQQSTAVVLLIRHQSRVIMLLALAGHQDGQWLNLQILEGVCRLFLVICLRVNNII